MSISEDEAREIFLDRIRFKFHCAEQHLNNLKSYAEAKDAEGNKEFFNVLVQMLSSRALAFTYFNP